MRAVNAWLKKTAKEDHRGQLLCPDCGSDQFGFCYHIEKLQCAVCGHNWKVKLCGRPAQKGK